MGCLDLGGCLGPLGPQSKIAQTEWLQQQVLGIYLLGSKVRLLPGLGYGMHMATCSPCPHRMEKASFPGSVLTRTPNLPVPSLNLNYFLTGPLSELSHTRG